MASGNVSGEKDHLSERLAEERMSSPRPAQIASTPPFEQIFDDNFDYIWSSMRRLGVAGADAEDIVQELFITVHRRLGTYDPDRPIRPWLFGIATRVASDYRRLARHRREVFEGGRGYKDAPEQPSAEPAPDHRLERAEAQALVIEALQGIDEKRRPVFILHDIDGVEMKEVAEALSIPLHTGYSRLRKARREFADRARRLQARRRAT